MTLKRKKKKTVKKETDLETPKILNLTDHPVKIILNENEIIEIPSVGVARLKISTKKVNIKPPIVIEGKTIPIKTRKVKGIILPKGMTKKKLKEADGVIVSAQMVKYMKKDFPGVRIFTVGETIQELKSNGNKVIKGTTYLVLN